jgi:hypothetical protein
MEFLIGSAVALISVLLSRIIFSKQDKPVKFKLPVSQSYVHEIIKPALPVLNILEKMQEVETQSRKYERSLTVKVMVVDNKAYWIKDSVVYSADVYDDEISKESTKVVDMMAIDEVQLKKMMFIIEKLTEGSQDDSGNTGYTQL